MARRFVTILVLGALLATLTGCVGGIPAAKLTPKLAPPVISKPGVLRAAVDLSYPPFAGTVGTHHVGLDIDVAGAIADQLGLKLELMDLKPADAALAVKAGTVDVVLGGLTVDSAVASQIAFAGTYIADAPGVFAAKDSSVSVDDLAAKRIAVQKDSLAYWTLLDEYGETPLVAVGSLDEAIKSVLAGNADVAAGDALVGTYMLRSYPTMTFAGQVGSAFPLGVGVAQSKPKLETEVRAALDKLASQGVLETLRRKWFGEMVPLKVRSESSLDATGSIGATQTP